MTDPKNHLSSSVICHYKMVSRRRQPDKCDPFI